MAPPPPGNQPLQQRLMQLAQTLQFAWFCGHVTLFLCTIRYAISYLTFRYNSKWAVFSYRTAFMAAAVTYGIVVYKAYRARMRSGKQGSPLAMLADENVQYLLMALVWLWSRQIPLAILPFTVYSIFHIATYTRANLLPALQPQQQSQDGQPPKQSGMAQTIGQFVKDYYDSSMTLVALLEIGLWFRVLMSALLFQKGSWILLGIYSAFLRARYSQSSFVQGAIAQMTQRVDGMVANQNTPPAVRNAWASVKGLARQAAEATDINKYVGGNQQAGPKKAQ
ncbi:hypothetical protein W97_02944 [Coniosporium apollinis CBS 100218]|uniref:Nucleoporin POM33 n=1 Tax=Coniosporium apollinis (strain CBS 100218) TaxID=1168221 RepID=R7YPZ0_CONA1|nr:uncharacterized protein W97_02944 [Coniosporium apollinis CBS 100218]EON63716.1 hypothetical protein W97_02944 [Coniosporium apollinis CBS 100218]